MEINNMTREQFEQLPHRKWDEDIGEFDSLIIIPARVSIVALLKYYIQTAIARKVLWIKSPEVYEVSGLHGSGYRQMDFVAVRKGEPICLLAGGSDVIHFDGIGGYGYKWSQKYGGVPDLIAPRDWNIDCLCKSGLLQLFSHKYRFIVGTALSSFEIYCVERKKEEL